MSQGYFSAFARVGESNDGANQNQNANMSQYPQISFGMQQMNVGLFQTSTVNQTPAHNHQSPGSQQHSAMNQLAQSQWLQSNMSGLPRQMADNQNRTIQQVIPTTNMPITGTPILEWNGQEWITPQASSIAAVAAGHQVHNLPSPYSTLTQLTSWSHHQQHDTTQQLIQSVSSRLPNNVNIQQPIVTKPIESFVQQPTTPNSKSPAKRKSSKSRQPRHSQNSQAQIQQPVEQTVRRSNSCDDLLAADQLARMTAGSREEVARDCLLSLSSVQHGGLVPVAGITLAAVVQPHNHDSILTELSPVIQLQAKKPDPPAPPPRPAKPFDGRFAVCNNCGTMSKDYLKCDFCKRDLPDDIKMYDPVTAKQEQEKQKQDKIKKAETELLLLQKLKEEQLKKHLEAKQKSGSSDASPSMSPPEVTARSFYGRRIAIRDYSDDDPAWKPNSQARSRGGGKPPSAKRGRKPKEAEVYVISSDDDFGTDDEGTPDKSTNRTSVQRKLPTTDSSSLPNTRLRNPNLGTQRPDLTQIPELFMKCTKITLGTLVGAPKEPLHISISGVDINIETKTESVKVRLDNRDVKECLGCTNQNLPVLFFRANKLFGEKVRTALKMADSDQDPYYDPEALDAKHKYIVAYLDDKAQISNLAWRLQDVFRAISLQYQTGGVLLRFIDLSRAERLLSMINGEAEVAVVSSTKLESADPYDDSQEDLEQVEIKQHLFEGPIKKMFTYPFPPTVGGISVTNEDFFCLYEGEFLNDIVISFYLKYLTDQVLSTEDRERMFVFSTFFYTCLMQPFKGAKDPKKTLAERRHHKVKTWTKNVDLFSKDFIIIPINEHSHWYLAIICFPYLEKIIYDESSASESDSKPVSESVSDDNVVSSTADEPVTAARSSTCKEQEYKSTVSPSSSPSTARRPTIVLADSQESPSSSSAVVDVSSGSSSVQEVTDQGSASPKPSHVSEDPFGFDDVDDEMNYSNQNKKILKQPCILIFDSLAGPGHSQVIKNLKEYLSVEWKTRKGTDRTFSTMRGFNVACPQQNNYSDCGVYLLQYVESFFKNPITDWQRPSRCTKNWFDFSVIRKKRKEIQDLIKKVELEYLARPVQPRGRPRVNRTAQTSAPESTEINSASSSLHKNTPSASELPQEGVNGTCLTATVSSIPDDCNSTKEFPGETHQTTAVVQLILQKVRSPVPVDVSSDFPPDENSLMDRTHGARQELEKMEIKDDTVTEMIDTTVDKDYSSDGSSLMQTDS